MVRIPRKLTIDPIVEAIFEVRFRSDEVPEIVLGKLAAEWKELKTTRLPLADIPPPIRDHDPNLAHQPVWQLEAKDGRRLMKLGPRVFSYHALPPYPGWATFEPELNRAVTFLFTCLGTATLDRYGFRYVNVLTKDHFVNGLADLNFRVQLAGETMECPLNLNYQRRHSEQHGATVRVASKEFVLNPFKGLEALIDVDISTPADFRSNDFANAGKWVHKAHDFLKLEFFTLLDEALIGRLEEK